ncbi:MAG: hypothetical protein U5K69_04775 [Balneolaceae bacterium]|nr:hypothetical protein [Balneolaceae bacterium]
MIHFPEDRKEHSKARERFKFEELFLFELSVAKMKRIIIEKQNGPQFRKIGN